MTSSGWGGGGRGSQVKNDKNSDGSRWLQGGGGRGGDQQKLDVQSYN